MNKVVKTIRITALFLVMTALLAGSALAENVINPYFEETRNPPRPQAGNIGKSTLSIDVTVSPEPSFTEDTVWSVSVTGGSGSYAYRYGIIDTEGWYYHAYAAASDASTFSFRFVTPGAYRFMAEATDKENGQTVLKYLKYTLTSDTIPTSEDMARRVVETCIAAGCDTEFEKAVWLHDWIVNNTYYDPTYTYYSEQAVFFRGTGVCDAYSRAYLMLLELAGMHAGRESGGNHAWNRLRIDGQWYQSDPTWDDPTNFDPDVDFQKISGRERHFYCNIPDALMSTDHTYEPTVVCDSLEANYFIKTGKSDIWTDQRRWTESSYSDLPYAELTQNLLNNGRYKFQMGLSKYYRNEHESYSYGKEAIVYPITAYALSKKTWTHAGKTYKLDFTYDAENKAIVSEINFSGGTLVMPDELESIDEEAFYGCAGVLCAELPEGVRSIGARAFAGCETLWKITIPDSVTDIAESAFDDCPYLTIVCSSDAYALSYANNQGINSETLA